MAVLMAVLTGKKNVTNLVHESFYELLKHFGRKKWQGRPRETFNFTTRLHFVLGRDIILVNAALQHTKNWVKTALKST